MPNALDESPGMVHSQRAPPIRTPCLPPHHSAVDSAAVGEVEAGVEAIGIREAVETGPTSTTIEIDTREVDLKKAAGAASRKTGTGGTTDTQTWLGISGTTATPGTISVKLSVRNPIGCYPTNRHRRKMSHPRPSPPRRPLSVQFRPASRHPLRFTRSPANFPQPVPGPLPKRGRVLLATGLVTIDPPRPAHRSRRYRKLLLPYRLGPVRSSRNNNGQANSGLTPH